MAQAICWVAFQRMSTAMSYYTDPKGRRKAPRLATRISAVVKSSAGIPQNVEINDLAVGGCAVSVEGHRLPAGRFFNLKIDGLEDQASVTVWSEGQQSGLAFQNPLHPAVADHFALRNPRASRSQRSSSKEDDGDH